MQVPLDRCRKLLELPAGQLQDMLHSRSCDPAVRQANSRLMQSDSFCWQIAHVGCASLQEVLWA